MIFNVRNKKNKFQIGYLCQCVKIMLREDYQAFTQVYGNRADTHPYLIHYKSRTNICTYGVDCGHFRMLIRQL